MRVLVLGGTTEASALMQQLAEEPSIHLTLSLAGRTGQRHEQTDRYRVGGFGGAVGLTNWLIDQRIDAIVDATHPFAVRISANAVEAASRTNTPMITLSRPPWRLRDGDNWICVDDIAAAASAIGPEPRRVLLTIGRQRVSAFRSAPQHTYVVRSIEAAKPSDLPPIAEIILERGPFDVDAEIALMRSRRIEFLIAKNSGGLATYAKILAARELRIPVIMIDRPHKPFMFAVDSVEGACFWLRSRLDNHSPSLSERGV